MRTGWIASGTGHVALLLFLIFGGAFSSAPLPPMEVAEVTVMSEEEFAQLTRPETAPEAGPGITAPAPPTAPAEAPTPPARPELAETPPEPAEAETAAPAELTAPPPVDVEAPELPPSPEAAPRIAAEAQPEPEPDAAEAPEVTERVAPDTEEEAETVAEEQTPTAPEQAAPEIVTEAETPAGAPDAVPRPRARPDRLARLDPGRSFEAVSEPEEEAEPEPAPAPQPEPEVAETPLEESAPAEEAQQSALEAALAEALSSTPEAASEQGTAAGPPLNQGELDAFRVAVERCWNVGALSTESLATTVVVAVRLTRDGKPDTASIRRVGYQGGSEAAAQQAFEAARRAILRCGNDGFPLPPEKYERWAQVEMTFNPEGMRVR